MKNLSTTWFMANEWADKFSDSCYATKVRVRRSLVCMYENDGELLKKINDK